MHGKSIRIPGPRGLRARRVLRRVAREPKPPGRTAHSTRARAAPGAAPVSLSGRCGPASRTGPGTYRRERLPIMCVCLIDTNTQHTPGHTLKSLTGALLVQTAAARAAGPAPPRAAS